MRVQHDYWISDQIFKINTETLCSLKASSLPLPFGMVYFLWPQFSSNSPNIFIQDYFPTSHCLVVNVPYSPVSLSLTPSFTCFKSLMSLQACLHIMVRLCISVCPMFSQLPVSSHPPTPSKTDNPSQLLLGT